MENQESPVHQHYNEGLLINPAPYLAKITALENIIAKRMIEARTQQLRIEERDRIIAEVQMQLSEAERKILSLNDEKDTLMEIAKDKSAEVTRLKEAQREQKKKTKETVNG